MPSGCGCEIVQSERFHESLAQDTVDQAEPLRLPPCPFDGPLARGAGEDLQQQPLDTELRYAIAHAVFGTQPQYQIGETAMEQPRSRRYTHVMQPLQPRFTELDCERAS
jgi:hypothetical protein